MRINVFAFAIVAIAGSAAVAQQKTFDTSLSALNNGSFGDRAQGLWSTSFEAPAFVAGSPLEPQNGWTASGVDLPWASVTNLNAQDGAQSYRQINDPTVGAGTGRVGLSPSVLTPANTPDNTSWWVFISAPGGADYDYVGQAPSQGFLSWRVKLNFQGNIFLLDDTGTGLAFVDSGVAFPIASWFQLSVAFDPNANAGLGTINYSMNGNPFYSSVTGTVAGTSIEQFVTVNDNFQNAGEFADLDNITPAPGALALLGLGGLIAGRRRR
ncbi:hypothetical protein PHYC_01562 [Phycisphaerales bacterium]|nr:hypothetical protein PHYC_01562 [Phycisphaerales bacterium]